MSLSGWNGWTALASLNESGRSNIVAINAEEFVIASHTRNGGGINKYNTIRNDWTPFIKYPKDFMVNEPSIAYHTKTKKLYVYHSNEKNTFNVIDINSHEFITIDAKYSAGSSAASIVIDSKLHLIGGKNSNKHAIYNKKIKQFDTICPIWETPTYRHSVIYRSSTKCTQNTLYAFGGIHSAHHRCDEIWVNTLGTSNWQKLGIKMPFEMNSFGIVITNDQKYIILLGGVGEEWMSTIYVLNLDKMHFYLSDVQCPKGGVYRAVIMTSHSKNQHIVCGYIRNTFKGIPTKIPNELINILLRYYETEYVHLINKYGDTNHWKIKVDDILQCLTLL